MLTGYYCQILLISTFLTSEIRKNQKLLSKTIPTNRNKHKKDCSNPCIQTNWMSYLKPHSVMFNYTTAHEIRVTKPTCVFTNVDWISISIYGLRFNFMVLKLSPIHFCSHLPNILQFSQCCDFR